jgi:hypothetical protein
VEDTYLPEVTIEDGKCSIDGHLILLEVIEIFGLKVVE